MRPLQPTSRFRHHTKIALTFTLLLSLLLPSLALAQNNADANGNRTSGDRELPGRRHRVGQNLVEDHRGGRIERAVGFELRQVEQALDEAGQTLVLALAGTGARQRRRQWQSRLSAIGS